MDYACIWAEQMFWFIRSCMPTLLPRAKVGSRPNGSRLASLWCKSLKCYIYALELMSATTSDRLCRSLFMQCIFRWFLCIWFCSLNFTTIVTCANEKGGKKAGSGTATNSDEKDDWSNRSAFFLFFVVPSVGFLCVCLSLSTRFDLVLRTSTME